MQRQAAGPVRAPDAVEGTAAPATGREALAAADAPDSALRVEVTGVLRPTSDTIEVRFLVVNRDAGRPVTVGDRFAESPAETGTVSAAYITGAGGDVRHYVLRDQAGAPACSTGLDVLAPGERRFAWARFGSPGRAATEVVFQLPGLPPLAGLEIPAAP
jgi:hypothetical protein